MPKTPLANAFPTGSDPHPPAPAQRTQMGGIVPPAATPAPPKARSTPVTRAGTDPSPPRRVTDVDRENRIGTRMQGAEGLQEPGGDSPKLRLTAGKIVPGTRYRILRWLGEGGMGVVYEAEHIDIERKVALKILRFDLSRQPKMVQVFRDEARAASRLGSAHIVEIYDFGELPDGRLFFAMELLDGIDLVPSDSNTGMDSGRLVGILRQVCKGLHVAHRAGVVHRDVKPENIIVTNTGGRADRVKIVDFGISAMLAAGVAGEGSNIAGTPHYMAPEQITGEAFDGRLDIYALGCTAYELLTGSPPFDGDSIEVLLQNHLYEQPVPPSRFRTDLTIPPNLERVLLRCLAKDPEARFWDMADLEAALCEAQIADKLSTPWDDLQLPDLADTERRERLLRDMPSPMAIGLPSRRRWLWPVVAGSSTLAAVMFGLFLAFGRPQEPVAPEDSIVETLTNEARGAAARLRWVVPSQNDPDAPTAYSKVRELESVEGREESDADDRAVALRTEFANTLVTQGDTLWDQGALTAAKHHYLWALAFDLSNARAHERGQFPTVLLADFVQRADRGEFSRLEQVMADLTRVDASEDEATQEQQIAELLAMLDADDATLLGQSAPELKAPLAKSRARKSPPVAAVPDVPDDAEVLAVAAPVVAPPATIAAPVAPVPPEVKKKKRTLGQDPRELLGTAERDPKKAKALAESGMTALRAGKRSEASSLFNQAIAFDHTNAMALMGLSDVYFDTGSDQKAVVFAEKAVGASPANQNYRIKLGDAYFKVLRFQDALKQYEQAKKLGSTKADERINRVKTKLGG